MIILKLLNNRFSFVLCFKDWSICRGGKAGGNKPQHFPFHATNWLSCLTAAISYNHSVIHATTFSSSGNYYFLNDIFSECKLRFSKNLATLRKKVYLYALWKISDTKSRSLGISKTCSTSFALWKFTETLRNMSRF